MNEQERTKIIFPEPEKDIEELMAEKLAEFPYLSEKGQEEKKMQLKLLLRQGGSPALFVSLFSDPEELTADEIDVIRTSIRVTDEHFYYDRIRNYRQDISEVLEKTKLHIITAGLSPAKKDEADLFREKPYRMPYLIVSSPAVISEISAEVRKHYEKLLESIHAEIISRLTRGMGDMAASCEDMKREEIRRLLEGLKEKEKQIQDLREKLREHHIDIGSEEKAALEDGEDREDSNNGVHADGQGNARAPNPADGLIAGFFKRRTDSRLSGEARQVMDEYRRKKSRNNL